MAKRNNTDEIQNSMPYQHAEWSFHSDELQGTSEALLSAIRNRLGLGNIAFSSETTDEQLLQALKNEQPLVRIAAIRAVVDSERRALIESLATTALHDHEWSVRTAAINALGKLAKRAPLTSTVLFKAVEDEHEAVRAAAIHALGYLGEKAPRELLIRMVQEAPEWPIREAAVLALGELGEYSTLVSLLAQEKNEVVRQAAQVVLRQKRATASTPFMDEKSGTSHQQVPTASRQQHEEKQRGTNGNASAIPTSHSKHSHLSARFIGANLRQVGEPVVRRLGSYEFVDTLGHGSFATVLLGKHVLLETKAAVKVLHTSLVQEQARQFHNEARTIAHLVHPNIVRVLDYNIERGTPFLVMDYAPYGTLRQRYSMGKPLSIATVVSYIKQVAAALQYAHDRGVIHLDVKPENILLKSDTEVLLSDFGIAVGTQSTKDVNRREIIGTLQYMAPEQIKGSPEQASDQYSLAVLAYEWLTGSFPFTGSNRDEIIRKHLRDHPPSLREKDPTIPEAIEYVILKALTKDPKQRFASVAEFATALEKASIQARTRRKKRKDTTRPRYHASIQLPRLILLVWLALMLVLASIALTIPLTAITIAPRSIPIRSNYTVIAVTTHPGPSPNEVQARILTAIKVSQSQQVNATGVGVIPGVQARGKLTFYNGLAFEQQVDAGALITSSNGIQVVTDETAVIPPANPPTFGRATVAAHALNVGSNGNILVNSIDEAYSPSIKVINFTAFNGGQDIQSYRIADQSDIDGAANTLEALLKPQALASLQKQIQPSERPATPTACTPHVVSDHGPGDKVPMIHVRVTLICSSEVYDQDATHALVAKQITEDAISQLGTHYDLAGKITTTIRKTTLIEAGQGTIALSIDAHGVWNYTFDTSQKQNMARMIAGKNAQDARRWLLQQAGVSEVFIEWLWNIPFINKAILPFNPYQIVFRIT